MKPNMTIVRLLQCYLLMQVDRPLAELTAPEGMLEEAHSQWCASCLKVCVSQLQTDVAEGLRKIGVDITEEYLTEDKLFSIDIAIPGASKPAPQYRLAKSIGAETQNFYKSMWGILRGRGHFAHFLVQKGNAAC